MQNRKKKLKQDKCDIQHQMFSDEIVIKTVTEHRLAPCPGSSRFEL